VGKWRYFTPEEVDTMNEMMADSVNAPEAGETRKPKKRK
jgi:hypothetical protein